MAGTILCLLVLTFFCQIYLYCRKKCCPKGKKLDKHGNIKEKKRAKNGMVVADSEDLDDVENGDVEMASPDKKPDKKSTKE